MTATLPAVSDSLTLLLVHDNAAYAWRNSSQDCMSVLHEHFAGDWTEALEPHAVAAMETTLAEVWAEHGYLVVWCPEAAMGQWDRDVPDETFHAVWDEAASRVDPYALIEAARLSDQYRRYAQWGER